MLEGAEGPNNLTQAQLLTAMTGSALDIEATGVDRDSGAGIVMAPGAVDAVDVAVADRNQAPTVEDTLDDRTFALGAAAVTIDLSTVFSDPNNDTLTYSALSSNTDRASLSRTGSMLTLTPGAPGTAQVAVRATDPDGLSAVDSFSVSIAVGTRDYDRDNDDLIEISTLAQLDAVRFDSNGNGVADDSSDWPSYFAAFTQASACEHGVRGHLRGLRAGGRPRLRHRRQWRGQRRGHLLEQRRRLGAHRRPCLSGRLRGQRQYHCQPVHRPLTPRTTSACSVKWVNSG